MSLRVLVVCEGNMCRSPLAERLFAARLPGVEVSSAGTHAGGVGAPMDPQAAAELVRLGGSAEGFRASRVTVRELDEADLVLTATTRIRARVLGLSPRAMRRTFTLLEFAGLARQAPPGLSGELVSWAFANRSLMADEELDVPDPIGGTPEGHRAVADTIDGAVDAIVVALAPAVSR
jgi:protein-tyrosine phosphatase